MKFEINLEKKYALGIMATFLVFAGLLGVVAYNSGGPPSYVGHTLEEIEPGTFLSGLWRFDGNLGINKEANNNWDLYSEGGIRSDGQVRGDELCIGNDCVGSWEEARGFEVERIIEECDSTNCIAECPEGLEVISGACESHFGTNWDYIGVKGNLKGWKCSDASWESGEGPLVATAFCAELG